jgi:hypothetical protein
VFEFGIYQAQPGLFIQKNFVGLRPIYLTMELVHRWGRSFTLRDGAKKSDFGGLFYFTELALGE